MREIGKGLTSPDCEQVRNRDDTDDFQREGKAPECRAIGKRCWPGSIAFLRGITLVGVEKKVGGGSEGDIQIAEVLPDRRTHRRSTVMGGGVVHGDQITGVILLKAKEGGKDAEEELERKRAAKSFYPCEKKKKDNKWPGGQSRRAFY